MKPIWLVLALLISGCAQAPADEPAQQEDEVRVVTDPTDTTYLENSTAGFHLHDYWGGNDTLTIVDDTGYWQAGLSLDEYTRIRFWPDDGVVVPLGTERLEVNVDWSKMNIGEHGTPELWVKPSNADAPEFIGAIESGDVFTIDVETNQTDRPHQILSGWAFDVRIPEGETAGQVAPGAKSAAIQASMKVTAHAGAEIPLFPPHPDHWDGTNTLDVASASYETTYTVPLGGGCFSCIGGPGIMRLDEGKVVPYDADRVIVQLDYAWDTPEGPRLSYHGADTRSWTTLEPTEDDGATRTYVIDLEAQADGPYAEASTWEFGFAFTAGQPYRGTMDLTVAVVRDL